VSKSVYSRWDGSQKLYSLEADRALDELSRLMMEGRDAREALEWMRRGGFDLAGMDFRVMGIEELLAELREQAEELLSRYNMEHTFDERWQRLREALEREGGAVDEKHGVESAPWSDLQRRQTALPQRLSEALERFRDYAWTDGEAEQAYQELLESLEEQRRLESFAARNRRSLQGPQDLDYGQAVELMEQVEALAQLARDLLEGRFEDISLEDLRERLGEDAVQSILILRDLQRSLEQAGYLRPGEDGPELTPRAIRRIGELALDDIYSSLSRSARGSHETAHAGAGQICTERSRPYEFGQPAHLDAIGTVRNALRRHGPQLQREGAQVRLEPDDLEVFETDHTTETTTVLLLDMSWSMSWSGRWPAAKRVAVAMDHLIRTRYPRDRFFIVGFYTRARELQVHELPELAWNMSDPFTNLQDGLRVAQNLISRHPSANAQIIVITDGQPTAYFLGKELHVEWPSGRGGISPTAVRETLREVRRLTRKDITINTFMLDDSPELLSFVEGMTRINKGRAFYTTPAQIGQYVMVDYMTQKRRRIR
jgi:uncharacterized protein with von Willebrand factor type A (vWA) domain